MAIFSLEASVLPLPDTPSTQEADLENLLVWPQGRWDWQRAAQESTGPNAAATGCHESRLQSAAATVFSRLQQPTHTKCERVHTCIR